MKQKDTEALNLAIKILKSFSAPHSSSEDDILFTGQLLDTTAYFFQNDLPLANKLATENSVQTIRNLLLRQDPAVRRNAMRFFRFS